jgi:hypothetical protein
MNAVANIADYSNAPLAQTNADGTFRVDPSKGSHNGRVSSEWYSRPDDERFLNLDDLHDHLKTAAEESRTTVLPTKHFRVQGSVEDGQKLELQLPMHVREWGGDVAVDVQPNHWSFGQLCSLIGAPAGYLRQLPAAIAGINLQYCLNNFREEHVMAYVRKNGRTELRALTGPQYGRVLDYRLAAAVRKIAGDGLGNDGYHWKIPGVLDWSTNTYNPNAPVTKQSTTLYASDRDVFMFLVDDRRPIEIGKLANGEPDILFRGFYAWNSEVGSKTIGVAVFYLRAVCMNRNLWGVEGFREVTFRHSSGAPERFAREIAPALEAFSDQGTSKLIAHVKAAKDAVVANTPEEQTEFLARQNFTKPEAKRIIESVLREEGKAPRSIWDFVQGITAVARDKPHQDDRIALEGRAGKLLDKIKA